MDFLKKLASAALPLVISAVMPEAMINTAVGVGVKHLTPMDNQQIPLLNLLCSSLVYYGRHLATGGDWVDSILPAIQEGGLLMAGSTALHQSLKISSRSILNAKGKSL